MKRQRTGRVLHFAVTGALLGGIGIGCSKHRGPIVNTEPAPQPTVNPGPEDATAPQETPEEPRPDHVNEGPVEPPPEQPEPPHVNVVKQPEPEPEPPTDTGTSTMNIRKQPEPKPEPKRVNVQKVPDPE